MAITITNGTDGTTTSFNDIVNGEEPPYITEYIKRDAASAGIYIATTRDVQAECARHRQYGIDSAYAEVKEALAEHYRYDRDALRSALEALGLPTTTNYLVHVSVDGTQVMTVNVEADNEEQAESFVSEGFSQYTTEVDIEFEYNGSGYVENVESLSYDMSDLIWQLDVSFEVEEAE